MEQMAVTCGDLDARETRIPQDERCVCKILNQRFDLIGLERMRHGPTEIVGQGGRADRIMRAPGLVTPATGILDLRHQVRIMRTHRRSPTGETRTIIRITHHHLLKVALPRQQVEWLGDEHRRAAPGAIGVVGHELIGDLAAGHVAGGHGCVHQPVTQRHMPQT